MGAGRCGSNVSCVSDVKGRPLVHRRYPRRLLDFGTKLGRLCNGGPRTIQLTRSCLRLPIYADTGSFVQRTRVVDNICVCSKGGLPGTVRVLRGTVSICQGNKGFPGVLQVVSQLNVCCRLDNRCRGTVTAGRRTVTACGSDVTPKGMIVTCKRRTGLCTRLNVCSRTLRVGGGTRCCSVLGSDFKLKSLCHCHTRVFHGVGRGSSMFRCLELKRGLSVVRGDFGNMFMGGMRAMGDCLSCPSSLRGTLRLTLDVYPSAIQVPR